MNYLAITVWLDENSDRPLFSVWFEEDQAQGEEEGIEQQLIAEYHGWGINRRR